MKISVQWEETNNYVFISSERGGIPVRTILARKGRGFHLPRPVPAGPQTITLDSIADFKEQPGLPINHCSFQLYRL